MLGKANGGGVVAFLNVTCPNSSTITIANGNITSTKTGTYAAFKLQRIGTWTVTASYNGFTETTSVSVGAGQTQNITMLNNIHIYNHNSYSAGFSGGWSGQYYDTFDGIWHSYDPISGDHVHAETTGTRSVFKATSNGSVNLTGIDYVRIGYSGEQDPGCIYRVQVVGTNGSTVLATSGDISEDRSYTTIDLDVRSINSAAKFQIYAERSGYGYAKVDLYDIWLRS